MNYSALSRSSALHLPNLHSTNPTRFRQFSFFSKLSAGHFFEHVDVFLLFWVFYFFSGLFLSLLGAALSLRMMPLKGRASTTQSPPAWANSLPFLRTVQFGFLPDSCGCFLAPMVVVNLRF